MGLETRLDFIHIILYMTILMMRTHYCELPDALTFTDSEVQLLVCSWFLHYRHWTFLFHHNSGSYEILLDRALNALLFLYEKLPYCRCMYS